MFKNFFFLCSIFSLFATEPVVLLGGGIGSLTSAIYLGRAGFSPVVIEGKLPGGLLTQSHMVQNWPGEMEIVGVELTDKIRDQATANGAKLINAEVVGVDFSKRPFTIRIKSLETGETSEIKTHTAIIGMGTEPNYLGVPGEKEFWGKGVTNCAVCDGALYKDKVVCVVGGGDAAVLEALYLSNIAKQVYIFVRKDFLRAIEERRVGLLKEMPNVKFIYNTSVVEIQGDGTKVTGVMLKEGSKKYPMALDGVFLAIGSQPNSKIFQKQLKLDSKGYIVLTKDQLTSVKGVYAVGDIVDPVYKQAISAAGDGAKAALQAQRYLEDNVELAKAVPVVQIHDNVEIAQAAPVVKKETKPFSKEIIEIKSEDQFYAELETDLPVLVDFYATWCPPCKRVAPVLEAGAKNLAGRVKVMKVNVDKQPGLAAQYQILGMPTAILFQNGEEVERRSGAEPIAEWVHSLESQESQT